MLYSCIACTSRPTNNDITSEQPYVVFLDEYIIPFETYFDSTWVGGLSGIDNWGDHYVIISDDAARYQAPRFYKSTIDIRNGEIDTISFDDVVFFRNEDDELYPDIRTAQNQYVDPEGIRLMDDTLYWVSEGFRNQRSFHPSILVHKLDGSHLRTYETDPKFRTTNDSIGPRHNASFEGLAVEPEGKYLWVSMENPLLQDGDVPSASSEGAPIRISKINIASGKIDFEFGYQLEPIFTVPDSGAFAMNGAVEVLWLEEGRLLVLERSYVAKVGNKVRLYRADYDDASDIKSIPSLKGHQLNLASKTLILDFDDLPVERVDNVEGICWGPVLPNGNRTLIFVADNNFSDSQINQVVLVEVNRPLNE